MRAALANSGSANPLSAPQGLYLGFMSKIKHKSLVVCLASQNKEVAFIDSGATDHFFLERRYFELYVEIGDAEIDIASGTSRLVGKGIVTVPIENGINVTAFRVSKFEANIVCPRLLAKTFDISFSEFFRAYNACFLFKPGTQDAVAEYPQNNMMCPIDLAPRSPEVKTMSSKIKSSPTTLTYGTESSNILIQIAKWHCQECSPKNPRSIKLHCKSNSVSLI